MKTKLKNPYVVVILLLISIEVLLKSLGLLFSSSKSDFLAYAWDNFMTKGMLLVIFYMINKKILKVNMDFYSNKVPFKKQVLAASYYMLTACIFLATNLANAKLSYLFPALLIAIGAGVVEEYLLRGLVLGYLLQYQKLTVGTIRLAVFFAGISFGLLHIGNLGSQNFVYTIGQTIFAALSGILVSAVYARTRSLLWVIVEHFLWDFTVGISRGIAVTQTTMSRSTVFYTIVFGLVLYLIPSLILLRRKKLAATYGLEA